MTTVASNESTLFRDLRDISERQKISPMLSAFIDHYFADADLAGLGEASPEDLHSAALQHHRLASERSPNQAVVALYTPDFDRHGWHSPHTVVDVVTDDMPFLVDSLTMTVYRRGLAIHRMVHPVLGIDRDASGKLMKSVPRGTKASHTESWIHLEIDRISDAHEIEALKAELADVLADVRAAVEDHLPMRQSVASAIADLETSTGQDRDEITEFLRWVASDNFVFLGYTHYRADTASGELKREPEGGLGLLRRADHPRYGRCLAGIPGNLEEIAHLPSSLTLVKADARSTLHRPNYLDFIGVHHRDATGKVVGEHVFVGLYAMHVYHVATTEIPVVRQKVAAVRAACGYSPGSYRDKALINVLETYPRNELIEIATEDLLRIANGIVMLEEHPRVRVFLRDDNWGRYVSALLYMPRDRFDTAMRKRIIALLKETLQADSVDFSLQVGESRLARMHLIARNPGTKPGQYDAAAFEREVARIVRGWHDELHHHLVEHCGEERGNALLRRYGLSLPLAYQDQVPPTSAVSDLERLEAAEKSGRVEIKLNAPYGEDGSHQHLKLFLKGSPRPLSAVLPLLENLGITVLSEQPFNLSEGDLHIADFAICLPQREALDGETTRAAFLDLLEKLLRDEVENDGFNRLTLLAGLDERSITILRAYGRYLRQAGLSFSQGYIERCLSNHPQIARLLTELFVARLSPDCDDAAADAVGERLGTALAKVTNIDDDRILSGYRTAIEATVRTNAWQTDSEGKPKPYLSFKISSKQIPFLPKPLPLYETFVYNQRMEGIHLRGSRVSRGGLRWSDRMEDYRTEGLGLVKAQTAKNAVIVALGAKGCFVGKRLPSPSDRDAYQAEGVACYMTYIRGLLDITDNIVAGKVVPPANVRRRDGDDPYLVVAADKGTATFSDTANGIANEYGFWLGDAFASGGSVGYDHKKMGITARGAWEAAKRHFRELGHDTQTQPFVAVGIGDMSGDVFGNAMLRSKQIKLVAAFDHRHIFLDPNPDCEKTFAERERLFNLPRSSWDDFDRSLISEGGGVWSRAQKTIPLSPQVRERLAISAEQMTPADLMNAILKAPVDLLYNGGIGTYVKASSQSHQDANDRSNDALRVDATELRVKVVVEGGNLGLTQKARIEYSLNGGQIYTDAIDNSAGVDCSDHEVNIKILLSSLVSGGDMTMKQRDALLASMTDDISRLVLIDNYQQTQAISVEASVGNALLSAHSQLIRYLESRGTIDRRIEALPDDKGFTERAQMGRGLTPPEIAVLLAYTKIALKEEIVASPLPDAPELQPLFADYFPEPLLRQCGNALSTHPLRREIITMQLVNRLVNRMGPSFVIQVGNETGATSAQIAAAWFAASELLETEALWHEIESLDLKIPASEQLASMAALRDMTAAVTRQILASQQTGSIGETISLYQAAVSETLKAVRGDRTAYAAAAAILEARSRIVGVFELVDFARASGKALAQMTASAAKLDTLVDFAWLAGAIDRLPAGNRWQARARAQLASELRRLRDALMRKDFAEVITASGTPAVIDELKRNPPQDLAMLSAGLAEIKRLTGV